MSRVRNDTELVVCVLRFPTPGPLRSNLLAARWVQHVDTSSHIFMQVASRSSRLLGSNCQSAFKYRPCLRHPVV